MFLGKSGNIVAPINFIQIISFKALWSTTLRYQKESLYFIGPTWMLLVAVSDPAEASF